MIITIYMYLFEINGQRLLLECGLYQGKREESIERCANDAPTAAGKP